MRPQKPFDPDEEFYELDRDDDDAIEPNEGEGNRSAARRYQDKVKSFIDEGRVGVAARDAASAVDGPEGPSLRAAEEAGKSRAKMSKMQQLKGIARAFIHGAKAAYEEAKNK